MMMIKIKRLRLMTTMTMMTTTAHWSCYPIVHSLMGLPTTPFDFQTPSLAKFRSTTFLLSTMVKIIIWTLNIKAASLPGMPVLRQRLDRVNETLVSDDNSDDTKQRGDQTIYCGYFHLWPLAMAPPWLGNSYNAHCSARIAHHRLHVVQVSDRLKPNTVLTASHRFTWSVWKWNNWISFKFLDALASLELGLGSEWVSQRFIILFF